jgi:hypothetical protein
MTRENTLLTDAAYIVAYKKLAGEYDDNQLSMQEYLSALEALKARYLKGRTSTVLPVVAG